jgi:hypothetical protein
MEEIRREKERKLMSKKRRDIRGERKQQTVTGKKPLTIQEKLDKKRKLKYIPQSKGDTSMTRKGGVRFKNYGPGLMDAYRDKKLKKKRELNYKPQSKR